MMISLRINRRSSLYYVESVNSTGESRNYQNREDQQNGSITAQLQYIPLDIEEWERENRDFKWYISVPLTSRQTEIASEGAYIYYLKNEGFQRADNDDRVKRITDRNNELFRNAEELIVRNPEFPSINNISMLYSYHINVGHGNLSLIVFEHNRQIHLWMIDGSNFDFRSHRNHSTEIEYCLNHIVSKFKLSRKPHIDVLMITHAHYDHYSAITSFIREGLIDSRTMIYLNLYKRVNNHNFNNLLDTIIKYRMNIIPPFVQNGSLNINILYPDLSSFSNKLKINNTSSVYLIRFDNIPYFVFPGDLETDGWDKMENLCCCPFMKGTKYYAISHHGSLNGHLWHPKCKFRYTASMADCLHPYTKTVLMGRDKAFKGIYSKEVLNDFFGRLYFSEKDKNNKKAAFLEIDLISGIEKWY